MDEDDDIDQKVKVKKVRGGKIVQSVQTTFTKQEKRREDDTPGIDDDDVGQAGNYGATSAVWQIE